MRVIIVRVKNREELHPLIIGLLDHPNRVTMGDSINNPPRSNGYYTFALRDQEKGPNMVYTYERGDLKKEEYKSELHDNKTEVSSE